MAIVGNAAKTPIYRILDQYLFRPGGAYNISICRITLFSYLYLHVYWLTSSNIGDGGASYLEVANIAAYDPKSFVYLLFPSSPPPAWFIDTTLQVAAISTLCAIAGIATRISMVSSVLSCTFLAALQYSWEPLWSHPYNGGLLAGFGFMFGRAGDTISVDAMLARYVFRRPIKIERCTYWWPVILGLFGTCVVYFGGFYAKWSTPEFTYDFTWVFSDNLRNSIALPWLIFGHPIPWQVDLIISKEWLWKFAAFGHLVTQSLPILALFSLRHPWLRLAEGAVFVSGIFLLKIVMGFWNPLWILLGAFFIDWEYFSGKIAILFRPDLDRRPSSSPARRVGDKGRRAPVIAYAFTFVAANLIVILTRFDDFGWNRAYPISSMNFYSDVAALKPYSSHLHYPFQYSELELEYRGQPSQKWFCHPIVSSSKGLAADVTLSAVEKVNREIGAMNALVKDIEGRMGDLAGDCYGTIDIKTFEVLDLYNSILHIPPYPLKIERFEIGFRALMARYERGRNRIIAAAADVVQGHSIVINVASQGLEVERYAILLANDPWKNYRLDTLIEVPGVWQRSVFLVDGSFYRALPAGRYPILLRVTETSGQSYGFFGGVLYRTGANPTPREALRDFLCNSPVLRSFIAKRCYSLRNWQPGSQNPEKMP